MAGQRNHPQSGGSLQFTDSGFEVRNIRLEPSPVALQLSHLAIEFEMLPHGETDNDQ